MRCRSCDNIFAMANKYSKEGFRSKEIQSVERGLERAEIATRVYELRKYLEQDSSQRYLQAGNVNVIRRLVEKIIEDRYRDNDQYPDQMKANMKQHAPMILDGSLEMAKVLLTNPHELAQSQNGKGFDSDKFERKMIEAAGYQLNPGEDEAAFRQELQELVLELGDPKDPIDVSKLPGDKFVSPDVLMRRKIGNNLEDTKKSELERQRDELSRI